MNSLDPSISTHLSSKSVPGVFASHCGFPCDADESTSRLGSSRQPVTKKNLSTDNAGRTSCPKAASEEAAIFVDL